MRTIAKFVVYCALIFLGIMGGGLVLFGTDSFARSDELLVAGLFLGIAWVLSEIVLSKLAGEPIVLLSGTELPGPWVIILFVLIIGGFASGVHSVFRDEPDLLRQAPSVASLDSVLQTYSSQESDFDSEVQEGRLEPGAIVVNVLSGSLHPLYRELPSGIRAVTPDAISTIVYVNSSKQPDSTRVLGKDRIDAYQQSWSIAMVSLRDGVRHVEYRNSFIGSSLGGRLGIGESRAGEVGLYRPRSPSSSSPELIPGAELIFIFGDSGGAELIDGRRVTGVVGPPPFTEALEWITESEKWVEGTDIGQKYLWLRILLWILVFGSLAAAPFLYEK